MPSRLQNAFIILFSIIGLRLFIRSFTSPARTINRPPPTSSPLPPPVNDPHGTPVFQQRLVAVGDLHGDITNAQKVLRMAKIVDSENNWAGGGDILVQTGDIVDRGTYALDIYEMMRRLRGEAEEAGGRVVSILGNHEIMNAIGDWRYVTQPDIQRFGSSEKRQQILSKDGWLGKEWLANYSSTALVPLGPYPFSPTLSFTHGSLRPSFPNLLPYPSAINNLGHSLLLKALTPPLSPPYPPNPYSGLPKSATREEAELYASGGPFWWRGLAEVDDEGTVCMWAGQLKEKLGVRRIIGGHTPNFERIVDRCNASIIIIDTGISSAYGGALSALEIVYTLTPVKKVPDHRQDPFLASGLEAEADTGSAIQDERHRMLLAQATEESIEVPIGPKGGGQPLAILQASPTLTRGTYIEREVVSALYEGRHEVIRVEERAVSV